MNPHVPIQKQMQAQVDSTHRHMAIVKHGLQSLQPSPYNGASAKMAARRNSSSLAANPVEEYGALPNQYAQSKVAMLPKYQNNARNHSTVDKDIQYSSVDANPMLGKAIFNTENRQYGRRASEWAKEETERQLSQNLVNYNDMREHGLRHGAGYSNMAHKATMLL